MARAVAIAKHDINKLVPTLGCLKPGCIGIQIGTIVLLKLTSAETSAAYTDLRRGARTSGWPFKQWKKLFGDIKGRQKECDKLAIATKLWIATPASSIICRRPEQLQQPIANLLECDPKTIGWWTGKKRRTKPIYDTTLLTKKRIARALHIIASFAKKSKLGSKTRVLWTRIYQDVGFEQRAPDCLSTTV